MYTGPRTRVCGGRGRVVWRIYDQQGSGDRVMCFLSIHPSFPLLLFAQTSHSLHASLSLSPISVLSLSYSSSYFEWVEALG